MQILGMCVTIGSARASIQELSWNLSRLPGAVVDEGSAILLVRSSVRGRAIVLSQPVKIPCCAADIRRIRRVERLAGSEPAAVAPADETFRTGDDMLFGLLTKRDRPQLSDDALVPLRVSSMREALRCAIADCFEALEAHAPAHDIGGKDPVRGARHILEMRVAGYARVLRDIGVRESQVLAEVRQAGMLWIELRPDAQDTVRAQVLKWTTEALRKESRSAARGVANGTVLATPAGPSRRRPLHGA